MTKAQARGFERRWSLVNSAGRAELRRMSMEEKFHQLVGLMSLARGLPRSRQEEVENARVRERWMRLRRAYRG